VTSQRPATAPTVPVVSRPEEVTHLVCCRSDPWDRAFCGEPGEALNDAPQVLCSMCLEEGESRLPGWSETDPTWCPFDGRPCPGDAEREELIARRTGRPVPDG
jgi:hypothetical protein